MENTKHFIISVALSILLVLVGTLGYMLIEGWNALDSLFMTITTLATVGYGEVHALTTMGRIYSIILILLGVGFFLYVGGAVVQFMVEGRVRHLMGRRRLDRRLSRLKDHFIICGFGRIGKVIVEKLRREHFDLVVIEKSLEMTQALEEMKIDFIIGDAGDEAVLLKAGILRAKTLVAVLATDTDNVFLVLTARQLVPELKIIARAGNEASRAKLTAAGADHAEAPYETGAATMAQRIIRPNVTNFLDLAFAANRHKDIQMEEIPVASGSRLNGLMLKDSGIRQQYNLIIVAIKSHDDQMLFNPSFEAQLKAGDTVIAVGEPGNLKKLEAVLNPSG